MPGSNKYSHGAGHKARDRLVFGQFSVLPAKRELRSDGVVLDLAPKALDLLIMLIEHRNRVVLFDEMLARIWKGRPLSRGVIAQVVRQIRLALDDDALRPRWIKSFHGVGYRFVGDVVEMCLPTHDSKALHKRVDHRTSTLPPGRETAQHAADTGATAWTARALWTEGCNALERRDFAALATVCDRLRTHHALDDAHAARLYEALLVAQSQLVQGDPALAQRTVDDARAYLNESVDPHARTEFHLTAALVASTTMSLTEAVQSIEAAWELAMAHGTALQASRCALTFGRTLRHLRLNDLASRWFARVRRTASAGHDMLVEMQATVELMILRVAQAHDAERRRRDGLQDWASILREVEALLTVEGLPGDAHDALTTARAMALRQLGRVGEAVALLEDQIATCGRTLPLGGSI